MPRSTKLREFVDEVAEKRDKPIKAHPDKIVLTKANAEAAAEFVEKRLRAASKGGVKTAKLGKSGRPIDKTTKIARQTRERVRRYRARQKVP